MGTHFKNNEEKISTNMIIVGVVIIGILVASLIIYLINANNSTEISEEQQIGEVEEDYGDDSDYETVSIDIGKSVNEASNESTENTTNSNVSANNTATTTATSASSSTSNNTSGNTSSNTADTANETSNTTTSTTSSETSSENSLGATTEIKFTAPISGEIIRGFASDSLVYSDTLEEWITHNGVDIKADKTSVVKAAAAGTVYSIKNDPRYGLTVIVNHEGGYQTVYSNLLTAEYVVEGEKIEVGQTIGTVGNSATFEISDDYHLHFELIKDGEYLDPTNYMDF